MGILGSIFNDLVDIVTTPVTIGAKILDDVTDVGTKKWVDDAKKAIKTKKDN